MESKKHIKSGKIKDDYFPKAIFWDVDPSLLDVEDDKWFIIDRVLARNMGNPVYFEKLEALYSRKDIVKRVLSYSEEIRGNVKLLAIANRYEFDPNKLKNYNPAFG